MKPGYQTTELAVTLLADIGILSTALAGALPAKWAASLVVVAHVAYALSRGLAKLNASKA